MRNFIKINQQNGEWVLKKALDRQGRKWENTLRTKDKKAIVLKVSELLKDYELERTLRILKGVKPPIKKPRNRQNKIWQKLKNKLK